MQTIPLLLVGDAAQAEFTAVARDLLSRPAALHCRDLLAAQQALQTGDVQPELIIVLQARPGEFAECELAALQPAAPLARILLLYGAWCEANPRAGKPAAAGRLEIAAHRWPQWWAIQLNRVANGRGPDWAFPVTMTPEERHWPLEPVEAPPARTPRTVGIFARDRATSEALSEACRGHGYSVELLSSASEARACDCILWSATEAEAADTKAFGARPWIALLDFPRVEDCERWRSQGVAAVLSRPFDLDELFWRIDQL